MALDTRYNLKSPGVKRLMREASELAAPTEEYSACPLEDNLFEWHFTVRGPPNTEFEGGLYHGRILLPSQYPMQPPNIILLTPNGRFETNKKICLSISGHHPESWQPSWSIRTALLALIAFMPTPAAGTIGSLDYTKEERQILAKKSRGFECQVCGNISNKLAVTTAIDDQESKTPKPLTKEESSLLSQIALKAEEETTKAQIQETQKDTEVRQRQTGLEEREEVTEEVVVTTTASVRPNQDKILTTVAWVVVVLIVLLAIRRMFYI